MSCSPSRSCRRCRTRRSAKLLRQSPSVAGPELGLSQLNPWLAWLRPAARGGQGNTARRWTRSIRCARPRTWAPSCISASLDYYRGVRDAMTEAGFFTIYANMSSLYLADKDEAQERRAEPAADPRDAAVVREALASIERRRLCRGARARGLPAHAQGRTAAAVAAGAARMSWCPTTPTICRTCRRTTGAASAASRKSSLATSRSRRSTPCPLLLDERADRERLLTLLDKLLADQRVPGHEPTRRAAGDAGPHPQGC